MKYLIEDALEHRHLWRDEGNHYWLARLQQEVAELVLALVGQHDDLPSHELGQIATICINWLEKDGYFTYPEQGQDSKQGYKQARGVIPWHEGDERPEDTIRRIRDGEQEESDE